jgi:hypothetical protein
VGHLDDLALGLAMYRLKNGEERALVAKCGAQGATFMELLAASQNGEFAPARSALWRFFARHAPALSLRARPL